MIGDSDSANFSNLTIEDEHFPYVEVPDTILFPKELGNCVEKLVDLKARVYSDLNGKHPE